MKWVDEAVRVFGRGLNIPNLVFDDHGVICLEIESMGLLFIERSIGSVLIYLSREVPPYQKTLPQEALEVCHYDEHYPFPVNAGMNGDNLIFSVKIPVRSVSPPVIEDAVDLLVSLHDIISKVETE